jgi:Arc/MetJ-type ribon-helix-helix transcriptional regulator
MSSKKVDVTAEQLRFIASEVKAGHFPDEKSVVQAGLALLENQQRKAQQREALLKEIQIGIDELDAGLGTVLHSREELSAHLKKLGDRARRMPRKKVKKV